MDCCVCAQPIEGRGLNKFLSAVLKCGVNVKDFLVKMESLRPDVGTDAFEVCVDCYGFVVACDEFLSVFWSKIRDLRNRRPGFFVDQDAEGHEMLDIPKPVEDPDESVHQTRSMTRRKRNSAETNDQAEQQVNVNAIYKKYKLAKTAIVIRPLTDKEDHGPANLVVSVHRSVAVAVRAAHVHGASGSEAVLLRRLRKN
ncbi:unnamed protein product, partial [Notodromas monacha]